MPNCLTLKKSNCKNCYKCIRNCPVKSIRFSGNQAHIIGNECILCGRCFVVCPQNAKEIVDETEKVKVLIQSGDPVVVSLAPSFVANYEGVGIEAMREALKKLGFYDAEETALGATLVKREYEVFPQVASVPGRRTVAHAGPLRGYQAAHSERENCVHRPLRGKEGRGGIL